MIDRLRQMAIFAKTIDHGSFRGAARALRLSPSVVSHHVSQLEEHLGVALLYRSTRKLALTPEGTRLLEATRRMLEAVEGELADLSETARAPSGELRLTIASVLSQSEFIDRIAAFSKAYPKVRLALDFSDMRRDLIEDGYDLAIRMGPDGPQGATARTLFSVRRILVASADYVAARDVAADPRQVQDWDWLALTPAQHVPMAFRGPAGERVTIRRSAKVFSSDAQALFRLARAGAGIAAVPEFLAAREIAEGTVVEVLPGWEMARLDVFANWPANAPRHGLIHLLLGVLSERAAGAG